MKIAVYSRNADTRKNISEQIKEYAADCMVYAQSERLLKQYKRGELYDAVYIEPETESDIAAAKLIRKCDRHADIVLIVVNVNDIMRCLEAAPTACIMKPISREELEKTLCAVHKRAISKPGGILLRHGRETIKASADDIVYIESSLHNIVIHMRDRRYEVKGKLDTVLDRLNPCVFAKTHRSYAVNLGYVSRYSVNDVHVSDGVCIPISRTYSAAFQEAYGEYCRMEGMRKIC